MKTKFLDINQKISIKGNEYEIVVITTEINGGRTYKAVSPKSNKQYEIVQDKDGTISNISEIS